MKEITDLKRRIQEITRLRKPILNSLKDEGEEICWNCLEEQETAYSYRYAFEIPIGYSIKDLEEQQDAIAASCGKVIQIKGLGGVAAVEVYKEDFPEILHFKPELLTGEQILLGYNRSGAPIHKDFTRPGLSICGEAGFGKTDLIRWIMLQLLLKWQGRIELDIIDMKRISFFPFMDLPNVRVFDTAKAARLILEANYAEVQSRFQKVFEQKQRSLTKTFPLRLIVIDEAAEITGDLEIVELTNSIARLGRELRIGILFATQYPTADVLPRQTKVNLDTWISLHVADTTASLVAIDQPGAEQLPSPGRAIVKMPGQEIEEIIVPYVGDDSKYEELLAPLKKEIEIHEQKGTDQEEYTDTVENVPDPLHRSSRPLSGWHRLTEKTSFRNSTRTGRGEADRREADPNRQA